MGDLVDKFKGEDAERKALLPVLQMFDKEVGTMILGQKSNLDLVEQTLRQELSKDFKDGQDLRIKILEKVAGAVGIDLDISNIELQAESVIKTFVGNQRPSSAAEWTEAVKNSPNLGKYNKFEKKKTQNMLLDYLKHPNFPQNKGYNESLNYIRKEVEYGLMRRELNRHKREHDIVFIRPKPKSIIHIEVKAMQETESQEMTKALKQLQGGKEEMSRIHGHVLDDGWTYLGVVCLPNLLPNQKTKLCQDLKICDACAESVVVSDHNGNLKSAMESALRTSNAVSKERKKKEKMKAKDQYKRLTSRMLAMEHLTLPISSVKRITGQDNPVVAAFTEGITCILFNNDDHITLLSGDIMSDPASANSQELETLKKGRHVGSPTSILFLTKGDNDNDDADVDDHDD